MSPSTRALPIFLLDFVRKTDEPLRVTYALSCQRLVIDEASRGVAAVHSPRMTGKLYEGKIISGRM